MQKFIRSSWNIFENVLYKLVSTCLKLCHRELTQSQWQSFIQFVKFCFIGVSNTLVSYVINVAVLFVLVKLKLFPESDYYIANIAAFILSVLWSFYWNNKLVFQTGDASWGQLVRMLLKTYVAYGFTGIVLNNVLSYVWIDMLHISKFVAPLINSLIGVPINFVINKFWAFKTEIEDEGGNTSKR